MYERLKAVFSKLNVDYEIIFVNDCSPDDSEEVIGPFRAMIAGSSASATRGISVRRLLSSAACA